MKIGLDLHGVVNEKVDFFRNFMSAVMDAKGEVHIITGPPKEQAVKEVIALDIIQGYHYTKIFSIVDYHKEIGTPMHQDTIGNWHMDHYLWDRTKADYCLKHQIDLMIDDSDTYDYFFKTPYARYKSKTKRTWHVDVDKIEYPKGFFDKAIVCKKD